MGWKSPRHLPEIRRSARVHERSRRRTAAARRAGSAIAPLPAPRWLVSVAVGIGGLALVAAGALYTDYVALKQQREQFAALETRLAEQQQGIDGVQQRAGRVGGGGGRGGAPRG